MGRVQGWNHCPRCGADIEPLENRVDCDRCGFEAYAHSDPTVGALVLDDNGRVLLARRAVEPDRGKWDVPGGFLEEGEHPLDALRRELAEETGLEIEPLDFVGVWMDRYGTGDEVAYTLNLYWTARVVSGTPRAADDVEELAWFGLDSVPSADELAFTNVERVLGAVRRSR